MRVAIVGVVGLFFAVGFAQFNPKTELIMTDREAVALLAPIPVSKGETRNVAWSHDGKFLFIETLDHKIDQRAFTDQLLQGRLDPSMASGERTLSIYSLAKQAPVFTWRFKADKGDVGQVAWLPGNRFAVFTVSEVVQDANGNAVRSESVYTASAANGQTSLVLRLTGGEGVLIYTDPLAKGAVLAIVGGPRFEPWRAHWLGSDGKLLPAIRLPGNFHPMAEWDSTGAGPYFMERVVDPETKKVRLDAHRVDFGTGAIGPVVTPQFGQEREVDPGFSILYGASVSALKDAQVPARSLWLESRARTDRQCALVAADVDGYEVSPASDAVFYTTKRVSFIRPLAKMPKDAALKALEAAEKAKAIQDVKQVGLAMMMYAADYDDEMVTNDGNWTENVLPYLKDRSLMDGFVYTFEGGDLSKLDNPAETEIGYKIGPGGRAVVYADGHVKWIPDAPAAILSSPYRNGPRGAFSISLVLEPS